MAQKKPVTRMKKGGKGSGGSDRPDSKEKDQPSGGNTSSGGGRGGSRGGSGGNTSSGGGGWSPGSGGNPFDSGNMPGGGGGSSGGGGGGKADPSGGGNRGRDSDRADFSGGGGGSRGGGASGAGGSGTSVVGGGKGDGDRTQQVVNTIADSGISDGFSPGVQGAVATTREAAQLAALAGTNAVQSGISAISDFLGFGGTEATPPSTGELAFRDTGRRDFAQEVSFNAGRGGDPRDFPSYQPPIIDAEVPSEIQEVFDRYDLNRGLDGSDPNIVPGAQPDAVTEVPAGTPPTTDVYQQGTIPMGFTGDLDMLSTGVELPEPPPTETRVVLPTLDTSPSVNLQSDPQVGTAPPAPVLTQTLPNTPIDALGGMTVEEYNRQALENRIAEGVDPEAVRELTPATNVTLGFDPSLGMQTSVFDRGAELDYPVGTDVQPGAEFAPGNVVSVDPNLGAPVNVNPGVSRPAGSVSAESSLNQYFDMIGGISSVFDQVVPPPPGVPTIPEPAPAPSVVRPPSVFASLPENPPAPGAQTSLGTLPFQGTSFVPDVYSPIADNALDVTTSVLTGGISTTGGTTERDGVSVSAQPWLSTPDMDTLPVAGEPAPAPVGTLPLGPDASRFPTVRPDDLVPSSPFPAPRPDVAPVPDTLAPPTSTRPLPSPGGLPAPVVQPVPGTSVPGAVPSGTGISATDLAADTSGTAVGGVEDWTAPMGGGLLAAGYNVLTGWNPFGTGRLGADDRTPEDFAREQAEMDRGSDRDSMAYGVSETTPAPVDETVVPSDRPAWWPSYLPWPPAPGSPMAPMPPAPGFTPAPVQPFQRYQTSYGGLQNAISGAGNPLMMGIGGIVRRP